MSFKYNIEKDVKYWIQVLTVFSFFNAIILFLLAYQKKMKMGAALWKSRQLIHTFLYVQRLCCACIISLWCLTCWCRNGDFPFRVHTETETQEGPRRQETEASLSFLLSFFLFTLSISLLFLV